MLRDHARDRARSALDSEEESRSSRRIAPISSRLRRLARASAIDDCRFYVSLFVVDARRATATGVRGDIRRNCEGCEREGGNDAGASRERARENSSSLFMSFLFDLLSSRSRFLFRSLDEREYESNEKKRRREWEKGRKVRVAAALFRPRGKSLVCQGRKKMRHFSA